MATAPASSIPSTYAGGVTLEAIMVQLECMEALLDTLTTKLYQVNTHVGRITQQQARLGGFVESPSLSLEASKDEDDSGDFGGTSNGDEASSSSTDDEMIASQ